MSTREKERTGQTRRRSPATRSPGTRSSKPQSTTKRRRKTAPETEKTSPDVVYLPPKPFNKGRFLVRLLTVAAIVLALVLSLSLFFEVKTVNVSGTSKYTPWQVLEASGIKVHSDKSTGDGLLTFSRARAAAKIQDELPYVDKVRFGIKLPDTVIIDIVEIEVTYAVKASDGSWWLVSSGGKVVEQALDGAQEDYTKILGVELTAPQVGKQAVAKEIEAAGTETAPVTVTQAQRLSTALDILVYLEQNGFIGTVTSLDVNDYGDIQLWYGQQYQVKLGDDTQLQYKIGLMRSTIDSLADYQTGVIDISFTTWPDKVDFSAFS